MCVRTHLVSFFKKKMSSSSHNALDVLPLEMWLHVAECSADAWFRLACSLSCVARYSLHEDAQTRAMSRFCNSAGFLHNGAKHGMHVGGDDDDDETERWYRNGKLHRDGDLPAVIRYCRWNGTLAHEEWWCDGVKHRDDGPAVRWYREDGTNVDHEQWYRNDVKHRDDDGPAVIRYYSDGSLEYEAWYRSGVKHRDGDLPAEKWYLENGTIYYEGWWRNDKMHRDGDLAAVIGYRWNGTLTHEEWRRDGELHRDDGDLPAVIVHIVKTVPLSNTKNGGTMATI